MTEEIESARLTHGEEHLSVREETDDLAVFTLPRDALPKPPIFSTIFAVPRVPARWTWRSPPQISALIASRENDTLRQVLHFCGEE